MPTKIEWCDETINPIIGCKRQCDYCYASRMATRLAGMPQTSERYAGIAEGGKGTGRQRFVPGELEKLSRWRKPRTVFIGSMGDLGDANRDDFIEVLDAVLTARRHTCIMLTKNPERLGAMLNGYLEANSLPPLPNLLIGVTVTDQPSADKMIPLLLDIRAAKRIVSYEPALGAVDFSLALQCATCGYTRNDDLMHTDHGLCQRRGCGWVDGIIAGPETGPGKRPADLEWFRSTRDQCADAGVPFFYKAGELDGVRHEEMP